MDTRNCGKLTDVIHEHAAICFLLDHTRECCAFLCHAPLPTHHVIYAGVFKIQRLGCQPHPDMLVVPLPFTSPRLERGSQSGNSDIYTCKPITQTLRQVCYATDSENKLATRGREEFGEGDSVPC